MTNRNPDISDETRAAVLKLLDEGEMSFKEIGKLYGLSPQQVSGMNVTARIKSGELVVQQPEEKCHEVKLTAAKGDAVLQTLNVSNFEDVTTLNVINKTRPYKSIFENMEGIV